MKNKDTNTDYHKFLGQGTKSEKLWNYYNRNHFFCLRFVFTTFSTGSFQVPPKKKSPPPKLPVPTQNPNLIPSLSYKRSEKWLSPLPSPRGRSTAPSLPHLIFFMFVSKSPPPPRPQIKKTKYELNKKNFTDEQCYCNSYF